ncbi:MAG: aldolase [Acidimicrobiales bacterium]|nr:aldolase [Acidimicrobiales bacterium]
MTGQATTRLRAEVAEAARTLAEAGLLIGTAGNISARDPESGLVAVTATGAVLGSCTPAEVTVVDAEGAVVAGDLVPTSELELHLAVLAGGPFAVVHTHAPAATAVSCVHDELPVIHYQQLLLGGAIRVAPYATFGSPALAAGVLAALDGRTGALMANHGAVTHGASLAAAVENALLLEWCSRLYLDAASLGEPRVLDDAQQLAVIEAAITRKYGQTQLLDDTVLSDSPSEENP